MSIVIMIVIQVKSQLQNRNSQKPSDSNPNPAISPLQTKLHQTYGTVIKYGNGDCNTAIKLTENTEMKPIDH
jgi:hypothetical protein